MMARSSRMLCSSSTTSTRMSGMRGQGEGEDGAHAGAALDVDLAAVVLHDPVHEGETEAGPGGLGGVEGLEDMSEIVAGDPLAGVGDPKEQPATRHRHRDLQLAALGHRLQPVEAEIPDDLPELLAVHAPRQRRRELAHD